MGTRKPSAGHAKKGYDVSKEKASEWRPIGNKTENKDARSTIFNTSLDNNLAVKDVYAAELSSTINSLYKFTNTFDISNISGLIKGGLSGLKSITSVLKAANQVRSAIKNKAGLADILGSAFPAARSTLSSVGLNPKILDNVQQYYQLGVSMHNTVQGIRKGDINLLTGLNDLGRALTGQDIALFSDIQSITTAVSSIITEFSQAGLEIKNEWNQLTNKDKSSSVYHGLDISYDVAQAVFPEIAVTGDYASIAHIAKEDTTGRIRSLSVSTIETMIREYSASAVFNVNKDAKTIFKEITDVIDAFKAGYLFWVAKENGEKLFNLRLFLLGSQDFRDMVKTALAQPFYSEHALSDVNEKPHIWVDFIQFFQGMDFIQELTSRHPGMEIKLNESVNTQVTPNTFASTLTPQQDGIIRLI